MEKLNFNPLVSVIIVNLNRKEDLRECIKSILKQDYPNIETIVVDNFSTDGSPEMIANEFPEVRLIRLDRNLGCPGGRNIGILNARGDFVFFVDNDAVLKSDCISQLVNFILKDNKIGAITPNVINFFTKKERPLFKDKNLYHKILYLGTFYGNSLVRKEVFKRCLFPKDYMYGGEESYVSYQMLESKYTIVYLPSAIVYHKESLLMRNRAWEFKRRFRNEINMCYTIMPLIVVPFMILKKLFSFLVEACKKNCIFAYLSVFPFLLVDFCVFIMKLKNNKFNRISFQTYLLAKKLNKSPIEYGNYELFMKKFKLNEIIKLLL